MIRFDHVYKRYPNGREAVSDLSLAIGRGEMVFLTGHSGAGKSTLLKLIHLAERPMNEGQMHFETVLMRERRVRDGNVRQPRERFAGGAVHRQ